MGAHVRVVRKLGREGGSVDLQPVADGPRPLAEPVGSDLDGPLAQVGEAGADARLHLVHWRVGGPLPLADLADAVGEGVQPNGLHAGLDGVRERVAVRRSGARKERLRLGRQKVEDALEQVPRHLVADVGAADDDAAKDGRLGDEAKGLAQRARLVRHAEGVVLVHGEQVGKERKGKLVEHASRGIALLRLDTDWYESTKVELDVLWPRLSPGGWMYVDDYSAFGGAKKAVDRWLKLNGWTEHARKANAFLRGAGGRVRAAPRTAWALLQSGRLGMTSM